MSHRRLRADARLDRCAQRLARHQLAVDQDPVLGFDVDLHAALGRRRCLGRLRLRLPLQRDARLQRHRGCDHQDHDEHQRNVDERRHVGLVDAFRVVTRSAGHAQRTPAGSASRPRACDGDGAGAGALRA